MAFLFVLPKVAVEDNDEGGEMDGVVMAVLYGSFLRSSGGSDEVVGEREGEGEGEGEGEEDEEGDEEDLICGNGLG